MPNYPYTFQLPPLNVQDIPNDGVAGEFLGINGSGVLDWLTAGGGGTGDMLKADNLLGLASYPTARTNLGLGTGDSPTFANLTLTSPSLVSSAPVTISQTWNNAAVTFTGLKVNAVSTASASGSLLADFQVNGVTQASIVKTGQFNSNAGYILSGVLQMSSLASYGYHMARDYCVTWGGAATLNGSIEVSLCRDGAANTLALRNGANAQTFNVYGTYTSGASYARLAIACDTSGNATLTTQSTGVAGSISIGNAQKIIAGAPNNVTLAFLSADVNGVGLRAGASNLEVVRGDAGAFANLKANDITVSGSLIVSNTPITSNSNVAGTNVESTSLILTTTSNGTTAAGFGTRLLYRTETDTNVLQDSGAISSVWSNTVNANRTSDMLFYNVLNGTLTERMRIIGTSGNVGIGTTAPSEKLHVLGGKVLFGDAADATGTAGNGELTLHARTLPQLNMVSNVGVNAFFGLSLKAGTAERAGLLVNMQSGEVKIGALSGSGYFPTFYSNGVEIMRFSTTGNVGIGTTSPTSKLHVVGDAVLTGQLLGSDYTVGTVATATQANIAITNNHAGQTNSSVVISPKGTGAFILGPKPDGTAVGGNARGNYAVDHQLDRSAASDVASGPNSCIGGGQRNVASGAYSVVAGGQVTVASGSNSFAGGGLGVTASGSNSFAGGGQTNTASGAHSVVTGGTNNTASESFSFVYGGRNASANRYALGAHSAGQFSQVGDAQKTTAVFRNKTTTNSAVELFLDGALQRYTVTSGKIISMLINITGTKSDGSAVAHYVRQYSIKNIGGTTSQVYAAVTVGTDNAAGTSIAISADDTNDSLKIEVTGVASETWRWVASVDAVEVGHGV